MNVHQAAVRYAAVRVTRHEFSHDTATGVRWILTTFADATGNPAIHALRARHIDRWYSTRQRVAAGTLRHEFSTIRVFLDYAVTQGWLKRHPMAGMRAPKMPRYQPRGLTQDEASKILAAARDERERVLILLGLQEGLRRCEMVRLQLGDINPEDRVIRVVGKGGHERLVPLSGQSARAISDYLRVHPATAGPLIRSYQYPTRGITADHAGRLITQAAFNSGVKVAIRDGKSPHALRHTAADAVCEASGGDVRLVQEMLGHQSLHTTSRYTKRLQAIGKLRQAADGRVY